MKKKIKVVELFAGVGGFRLGLEGDKKGRSARSNYKDKLESNYKIIWSNQWEPPGSKAKQFASRVYEEQWGNKDHNNENIHDIVENKFANIPDHDLLVGGFPCQDYSVATILKKSGGLQGKKGVLWWDIYEILRKKKKKPKLILLENVDRLLKSPVNQRGRDFAVILGCLQTLGYIVEWRVINAAKYGIPQRRRRVFILGYHESSKAYKKIGKPVDWLMKNGVFAKAFPVQEANILIVPESLGTSNIDFRDKKYIPSISENFNYNTRRSQSRFNNTGLMIKGNYYTFRSEPVLIEPKSLKDILDETVNYDNSKEFYVSKKEVFDKLKGWKYHKGAKSKPKIDKQTGFKYNWSEGSMNLI